MRVLSESAAMQLFGALLTFVNRHLDGDMAILSTCALFNVMELCFASGCYKKGTRACSKCKVAVYCSEKCQRQDWKGDQSDEPEYTHKVACKTLQEMNKKCTDSYNFELRILFEDMDALITRAYATCSAMRSGDAESVQKCQREFQVIVNDVMPMKDAQTFQYICEDVDAFCLSGRVVVDYIDGFFLTFVYLSALARDGGELEASLQSVFELSDLVYGKELQKYRISEHIELLYVSVIAAKTVGLVEMIGKSKCVKEVALAAYMIHKKKCPQLSRGVCKCMEEETDMYAKQLRGALLFMNAKVNDAKVKK